MDTDRAAQDDFKDKYEAVVGELKAKTVFYEYAVGDARAAVAQLGGLTDSGTQQKEHIDSLIEELKDKRLKLLVSNDRVKVLAHAVAKAKVDGIEDTAEKVNEVQRQWETHADVLKRGVECVQRGVPCVGGGQVYTIEYYMMKLRSSCAATPKVVTAIEESVFEFAEAVCPAFQRAEAAAREAGSRTHSH
jgi:hypothetical protein